jgi:hypothetical protein
MLAMVRTDANVLSSRASVTLWNWIGEDWKRLVRSFPVPDETTSKNIVAFAVSRFGDLPRREFIQALKECGIGFWDRWRRRRKSEAGGGLKVKHADADYLPFPDVYSTESFGSPW